MKDAFVVLLSAFTVAVSAHMSDAAHLHPRETPPPSRLDNFDELAPADGVLHVSGSILDDVTLAPYFDDIEFQNAGDAVLWIDQEGNVAVRLPVEQVVFFDANGAPIGAGLSERCARSTSSSLRPTILVCLAVDDLVPK